MPNDNFVGKSVFIRTVTNYMTGRIGSMDDKWIQLSEAAWIPETGRFSDALASGQFAEVEPYPAEVYVAVGSIVDFSFWEHPLPREKK